MSVLSGCSVIVGSAKKGRAFAIGFSAVALIGAIAGCSSDASSGSGGDTGEVKFAASCATAYKADGSARVYRLPSSETFEQALDAGVVKDTDGSTPITNYSSDQRARLVESFNRVNDLYNPIFAPTNDKENLYNLFVAVSGDGTQKDSAGASDGLLVGDACVMFGDRDTWNTLRSQGESDYVDGNLDKFSSKDYVPGQK